MLLSEVDLRQVKSHQTAAQRGLNVSGSPPFESNMEQLSGVLIKIGLWWTKFPFDPIYINWNVPSQHFQSHIFLALAQCDGTWKTFHVSKAKIVLFCIFISCSYHNCYERNMYSMYKKQKTNTLPFHKVWVINKT